MQTSRRLLCTVARLRSSVKFLIDFVLLSVCLFSYTFLQIKYSGPEATTKLNVTEVQNIIRQTTEQMEPFAADKDDFFNLPDEADARLHEAAKRSTANSAPAEFCGLEGFNASNSRLVIVSLQKITKELTLLVGEETSRTCNVHIVDEANVEALLGPSLYPLLRLPEIVRHVCLPVSCELLIFFFLSFPTGHHK